MGICKLTTSLICKQKGNIKYFSCTSHTSCTFEYPNSRSGNFFLRSIPVNPGRRKDKIRIPPFCNPWRIHWPRYRASKLQHHKKGDNLIFWASSWQKKRLEKLNLQLTKTLEPSTNWKEIQKQGICETTPQGCNQQTPGRETLHEKQSVLQQHQQQLQRTLSKQTKMLESGWWQDSSHRWKEPFKESTNH